MDTIKSKLTAQGQISVPATIRRRLGLGPGSLLEWVEDAGGVIRVQRAARVSSEDIHHALFSAGGQPAGAPVDVKAAIRKRMRSRHARG